MGDKMVRKVWALESGFNTKNSNRDKWFHENPTFLVMHKKDNQHLLFMPLAHAYAEKCHADNTKMNYWESTAAKEVKHSDDGRYRCYETESGTNYHLYQAGELTLF